MASGGGGVCIIYDIIWVAGLTLDKAALIPDTITIKHIHFSINGHKNNYCKSIP